jgi:hypothetical protein
MVFTDLNALLAFKHTHDEMKERAKLERDRVKTSSSPSQQTGSNVVQHSEKETMTSSTGASDRNAIVSSSGNVQTNAIVSASSTSTTTATTTTGQPLTARRNSYGMRSGALTARGTETTNLVLVCYCFAPHFLALLI